MSTRNGLTLVSAVAVVIAAISSPALARDRAVATTELSAQNTQNNQKNKPAPKNVAPRQAPVIRSAPVQNQPRVIQRQVQPRVVVPKQTTQPRVIQRQVVPQQQNVPSRRITTTPRIVTPGQTTARRVFTPRSNNSRVVVTTRIRSAPARGAFRTSIRGRNYSLWRGGYRVRYHGGWRTFVALSALGVLAIGAAEYYPYAYLDAPPDYCDGMTEDGCQLVYQDVETMDGDMVGQCVAYCPWQ